VCASFTASHPTHCKMRSIIICTLPKILLGEHIEEDDVHKAYSTCGRCKKYVQSFSQDTRGEKTTWETEVYMEG